MISTEEAKRILLLKEVSDVELLEVVRRYVYDRKGIDVGPINRIQPNPFAQIALEMLRMAVDCASTYYFKTINQE